MIKRYLAFLVVFVSLLELCFALEPPLHMQNAMKVRTE